MKHLKKVWSYGDGKRGEFVLLTAVLSMVLSVGLNIVFYYLNKNVDSITLTPRSINKFVPFIIVIAAYLVLNSMRVMSKINYKYSEEISTVRSTSGSIAGVILRIIKFILRIIFAPFKWVSRARKKSKEREWERRAPIREYYSNIRKIHQANAIIAEEIIREHNDKRK